MVLDVATQNPVRSVKILSAIFNFTDAVVVRYVGRGSGVRGRPCHVSIDFFFSALGRYYIAWGARRPSPSIVTLKLWFLSALVRYMVLFWHPAFVRNSTFAVFSVRHFRSAIFSVRSRSDFSGRLTLRLRCIPYPCTKFPAAAAAGTAQQAWAPTFDMKTCNEFQPFPQCIHTMAGVYSRPGLCK